MNFNDQQALSFVTAQAFRINRTVYETVYPDYDFSRLIYVDQEGPEWSPGVVTYTSDVTGKANWQSGYAKDVPLADVSQDFSTRSFSLAAIGYQYNIEEINTQLNIGGNLPDRRARAARKAYMKFMYDLTVKGSAEKGLGGLINYTGVTAQDAPADGTAGTTLWVDEDGVGQKTPDQIVRDVNIALTGVYYGTSETWLADTLLLPDEALDYISTTKIGPLSDETIESFIGRNNRYTRTTGRELTIRSIRELSTQAAGSLGRLVAYKNDPETVKLLLPMPHRFLPVYQDGPLNFAVPGIFRTGGVELLSTAGMRYLDKISEPRAA